jgi:hypothetical protein
VWKERRGAISRARVRLAGSQGRCVTIESVRWCERAVAVRALYGVALLRLVVVVVVARILALTSLLLISECQVVVTYFVVLRIVDFGNVLIDPAVLQICELDSFSCASW